MHSSKQFIITLRPKLPDEKDEDIIRRNLLISAKSSWKMIVAASLAWFLKNETKGPLEFQEYLDANKIDLSLFAKKIDADSMDEHVMKVGKKYRPEKKLDYFIRFLTGEEKERHDIIIKHWGSLKANNEALKNAGLVYKDKDEEMEARELDEKMRFGEGFVDSIMHCRIVATISVKKN